MNGTAVRILAGACGEGRKRRFLHAYIIEQNKNFVQFRVEALPINTGKTSFWTASAGLAWLAFENVFLSDRSWHL